MLTKKRVTSRGLGWLPIPCDSDRFLKLFISSKSNFESKFFFPKAILETVSPKNALKTACENKKLLQKLLLKRRNCF